MGYFESLIESIDANVINALILAISIATSVVALFRIIYHYMKTRRNKWVANTKMDAMITKQKDSIDKLISNTEKQLKDSDLKANPKIVVLIIAIVSLVIFISSYRHFNNFLASVLLAVICFSIPDYVFYMIQDKKDRLIDNQIIVGIRVFTSEYLKTSNIEKSLYETSQRVLEPVGGYFEDAYADMLMGYSYDSVITKLGGRTNNKYWKIFIQLLLQLKDNSNVIYLFTDLVTRIERHNELNRTNDDTLAGERTVSLIMSLLPIPTYFIMRELVEETEIFITQTTIGSFLIVLSLVSTLMFLYLDRYTRNV